LFLSQLSAVVAAKHNGIFEIPAASQPNHHPRTPKMPFQPAANPNISSRQQRQINRTELVNCGNYVFFLEKPLHSGGRGNNTFE